MYWYNVFVGLVVCCVEMVHAHMAVTYQNKKQCANVTTLKAHETHFFVTPDIL